MTTFNQRFGGGFKVDDAGLRLFPGFFVLAFFPGVLLGFSFGLQCFGFTEEDFAEAGWASLLLDLFRVRAYFRRPDEGSVFVFVGFEDRLRYGFVSASLAAITVRLRWFWEATCRP